MKPSARIQTIIDILERIANSRVPMDSAIGDFMRHRRYIGSKDRAYVAEHLYDIKRAQAKLTWWLERLDMEDTPRSRVLLWLVLAEGADEKRIKSLFEGTKYAPAELTPQELGYVKSMVEGSDSGTVDKTKGEVTGENGLVHKDMPLSVKVECPDLYEEKLLSYFGDDFEMEMEALLYSATLDLRVNTFLASRDKAQKYLEADGVKTTETPYSPYGLRCENKAYLSRTKAFAKGWVEIQDEGSQLIAHICDARPGMQVLDYCAGAGGKTLALGAAMERKGRIVAMDLDERRLNKSRPRFKKAKLADIIEVRPLSDDRHKKWLKRQKAKFDIVLLDVPCSGTGTWRRNPDMRWKVYGPPLEELVQIQAEIMDKVVHVLKPGGKLVYATCSLLPDENEQQIEAFLLRHDGFEVLPMDEGLGLGHPFMRLTPHRHQTDGFFAAALQKKIACHPRGAAKQG